MARYAPDSGADHLDRWHEWIGQHHCPEHVEAELRTCLRISSDAAWIIVSRSRDQAGPQLLENGRPGATVQSVSLLSYGRLDAPFQVVWSSSASWAGNDFEGVEFHGARGSIAPGDETSAVSGEKPLSGAEAIDSQCHVGGQRPQRTIRTPRRYEQQRDGHPTSPLNPQASSCAFRVSVLRKAQLRLGIGSTGNRGSLNCRQEITAYRTIR